jgi:hypothetical protein
LVQAKARDRLYVTAMSKREPNLPAWQWSLYPEGHADRRNLMVHALTMPLFAGGLVLALATPWLGAAALAGLVLPPLAMALQGSGHRKESVAPQPFSGPADVAGRILVEQLWTFPRYVVSGGFARAWRNGGRHPL